MQLSIFDYLRLLRRNWLLIAVAVLLGTLGSAGITALIKPTYTATTQLFVSIQGSGSVTELNQGSLFTQERVQTYVETVTTPVVLEPVIDELNLNETPESLAERVSAEAGSNTVLMSISVEDRSADAAAEIANAVGESLTDTVAELETPNSDETSPVQIATVQPATEPTEPSSPRTPLNLGLGFLVGLGLGLATALLRGLFDTRIRAVEDLRFVTEAPVLGKIAQDQSALEKPLITQGEPQSFRVESFKQLRTNLQFSRAGGAPQSILYTSSLPEEGKTTTSINTAISMADAGQRVLLIDGDLRRPRVAKYLGLEGSVGLTTHLVGQVSMQDALQPWGSDELYVLTSGRVPPNPSELLGSEQMEQLIADAEEEFDIVIIDGPPLLPVADSAVISRKVGGVILIVSAHKAKAPEVEKALESLELVDAKILGVVMNRLSVKGSDAYRYTYYGNEETKGRTKKRSSSHSGDGHEATSIVGNPVAASVATEQPAARWPVPDSTESIGGEATSAEKRGRHALHPAFDKIESEQDKSEVVSSRSRPRLRSPEPERFDEPGLDKTSSDWSEKLAERGATARHVRR